MVQVSHATNVCEPERYLKKKKLKENSGLRIDTGQKGATYSTATFNIEKQTTIMP